MVMVAAEVKSSYFPYVFECGDSWNPLYNGNIYSSSIQDTAGSETEFGAGISNDFHETRHT